MIRHTILDVAEGMCYGRSELPLARSFDAEWEVIKEKLPTSFDVVFTSPSQRCVRLAERLNSEQQYRREELYELDFGEWEMKKWDDINQHDLQTWMDDFVRVSVPGGESYLDLAGRTKTFLSEIIEGPFKKVAVVSHAGVIRSLISEILELPLENSFQLDFDHGRVSLINISQGIKKVEYLNR